MKNLADLAASLQTKITELFPGSFVNVWADDNLCSSLTLRFSIEPKGEWTNGIFYNSKCYCNVLVMCHNAQYEKDRADGHLYEVDMKNIRFPFKTRSKNKATLLQMEKHLMAVFQKLKENK